MVMDIYELQQQLRPEGRKGITAVVIILVGNRYTVIVRILVTAAAAE